MPYKSTKLKCWVGQVKMTVEGEEYLYLLDRPHWKRKTPEGNRFVYKKDQSQINGEKFKTKRAAQTWEQEHEKIIQSELTAATHITFSVYSTQYLKQVEVTCTGDNTFNYKKKLILDILKFYESDPPLPLSPLDIEKFLVEKARIDGSANANRARRELGTLFRWMIGKGIISSNPTETIKKFPAEKFKKYVPPREDILKVIAVADAEEKDIVRFALHSMARAGEIRRLKKNHCDFKNGTVTLYTRKTEDGTLEGGKIPMNKRLREILSRRCKFGDSEYVFPGPKDEQMSKNSLANMMPRLIKRVNNRMDKVLVPSKRKTKYGVIDQRIWRTKWEPLPEADQIKPFGLHALRHHVTAYLYLYEGYTIGQLQKLLRHKKPTTTETYLKSIVDMDAPVGLEVIEDFEETAIEVENDNVKQFKNQC